MAPPVRRASAAHQASAATQGSNSDARNAMDPSRIAVAEPANAGPGDAAQVNGHDNNMRSRRIRKEIADLKSTPTEGFTVELVDESIYKWKAVILGPLNTPYEGGHFELELCFPKSYPFKPPNLKFLTEIYHCNIMKDTICMDILSSNWSPCLTVGKLLLSIQSLLSDPNCESPLNTDAAEMYKNDREQHDRLAREWTNLYAKPVATTTPKTPPQ